MFQSFWLSTLMGFITNSFFPCGKFIDVWCTALFEGTGMTKNPVKPYKRWQTGTGCFTGPFLCQMANRRLAEPSLFSFDRVLASG